MVDEKELMIAWLAGLFDGEGSVSLGLQNERAVEGRVNLVNTRSDIIAWVLHVSSLLELPQPKVYWREAKGGRSAQCTINWSGQRAARVLEKIRPYMTNGKHCRRADIFCRYYTVGGKGKQLNREWKRLIEQEALEGDRRSAAYLRRF